MSIIKSVGTLQNSALEVIERSAINSLGRLGSLYDGCRDCILRPLSINIHERTLQTQESVRCDFIKDATHESQNLLETIGIQEELRISLLLNLAPRMGIAALIDHCYPTDKYTRFLYYYYECREERLPEEAEELKKYIQSSKPSADATHIITGISYGINVVVILQLPSDDKITQQIDEILEKIRASLGSSSYVSSLVTEYRMFLDKHIKTKAYSNITDFNQMTSVFDIYQYISLHKNKSSMYPPINYKLKPIQWLDTESRAILGPLSSAINEKIEQHLIQLSSSVKRLKYLLHYHHPSTILVEYLQGQLHHVQTEWQSLNRTYEEEVERLSGLTFQIRTGQQDASEIDQAVKHNNQMMLKKNIETLTDRVTGSEAKARWIDDLQQHQCEYYNVAKLNLDQKNYEHTLKQKLIQNNCEYKILCFSDTSKKDNQSKWDKLNLQLKNEKNNLRIIYADFSYCSFKLQDMMVLSSNKKNNNNNDTPKQRTSTTDEIVNILLLGESGVGKSTFINAFVNYITFETLDDAKDSKPVVLIPVSFLLITGNDFQERTVKFGDVDDLKNEDFDHPGQSVTQHCRSYVFDPNRNDGRKLRIIDTPGFGDTRGLDQDDRNMQHILEYVNNLTHLNAVCFLFKSNALQLNNYFQTCLIQLFDLLGPDARKNILFCFTNARSTFYTPGNTAPLLRTMLDSLSTNDIQFKKENTFCFDSESFRYLAALQNSFTFDNLDRQEYDNSWSTSATESKKLVNYICTQLNSYSLDTKKASIKHAQFEINLMIRPMLEAIRNLLRNLLLKEMESAQKLIELRSVIIHRPATLCLICKRNSVQFGNFWIVIDNPHEFLNECLICSCAPDEHIPIHHVLEYGFTDDSSNYDRTQVDNTIQKLRQASNIFVYFLKHVTHSWKDDPFLIGLLQMIFEENDICGRLKPNELNLKLLDNLKSLQRKYEQQMNEMKSKKTCIILSDIYQWIKTIREYTIIHEQMRAVKEGQKEMMKLYEYEVPNELTKTFSC